MDIFLKTLWRLFMSPFVFVFFVLAAVVLISIQVFNWVILKDEDIIVHLGSL